MNTVLKTSYNNTLSICYNSIVQLKIMPMFKQSMQYIFSLVQNEMFADLINVFANVFGEGAQRNKYF